MSASEMSPVEAVMGAYNRTNGEPCCASQRLLVDILRDQWKFQGHVVSDCGAIRDINEHHRVTRTAIESAALAVSKGCDLNCGSLFHHLLQAVEEGLIDKDVIDRSVKRLLRTCFRLGMFDPPQDNPYTSVPAEIINCPTHRELCRCSVPAILVLTGGGPLALGDLHDLVDAILYVWYPGEQGGPALADLLFGDSSPAGRLPLTFPQSVDQLPPYEDYSMVGRTYRYMEDTPLYPFGFGLSYSRFRYDQLALSSQTVSRGESLTATATVTNVGDAASDEVAQMYVSITDAPVRVPKCQLSGFPRLHLAPGETAQVEFAISPEMMGYVDEEGRRMLEPGHFTVTVGGSSPGPRSVELGAPEPVTAVFEVR